MTCAAAGLWIVLFAMSHATPLPTNNSTIVATNGTAAGTPGEQPPAGIDDRTTTGAALDSDSAKKIVIITLVVGAVFVLGLVYCIKRCLCCAPLNCCGIGSAAKSKARRAKQQEFAMKQQQQTYYSTPPLPHFHMPTQQQHFDGARDRDGFGYFVSASGPHETAVPVLKQPPPSYDARKTGGRGSGSKMGDTSWWDKCAGY